MAKNYSVDPGPYCETCKVAPTPKGLFQKDWGGWQFIPGMRYLCPKHTNLKNSSILWLD